MSKIQSLTPFLRRQIGWISLLYQQSHGGPHKGAHNQRTIALPCHIKMSFSRWRGVVLCFFVFLFVFCFLRICWLRNGTWCRSTISFWPKVPQSQWSRAQKKSADFKERWHIGLTHEPMVLILHKDQFREVFLAKITCKYCNYSYHVHPKTSGIKPFF